MPEEGGFCLIQKIISPLGSLHARACDIRLPPASKRDAESKVGYMLQVTVKADIYSFGVLLWEIITLERPLQRGNLRVPRCRTLPLVTCERIPAMVSQSSKWRGSCALLLSPTVWWSL